MKSVEQQCLYSTTLFIANCWVAVEIFHWISNNVLRDEQAAEDWYISAGTCWNWYFLFWTFWIQLQVFLAGSTQEHFVIIKSRNPNPTYDEGGAKNKDSLVVLLLYLNINEGHVLELPSHCSWRYLQTKFQLNYSLFFSNILRGFLLITRSEVAADVSQSKENTSPTRSLVWPTSSACCTFTLLIAHLWAS